MNKLIILFIAIFLNACAHQFELISRNNTGNGQGQAQEMGKQITIYLNGKTYKGTYIHDGTKAVTSTYRSTTRTSGTATAYSGNGTVTAHGTGSGNTSGYATTYIPGSGNGSLIATSGDDTIKCDFNYSNGSGIGYCVNNTGNEYDLIIR